FFTAFWNTGSGSLHGGGYGITEQAVNVAISRRSRSWVWGSGSIKNSLCRDQGAGGSNPLSATIILNC
ncbi:MAG: hypothetical protein WCF17_16800, partial [Terracidiphilus sp.]